MTIVIVILMSLVAFELLAPYFIGLDDKRAMYAKTRDVYNFHDEHVRFDPELGFILEPDISYHHRNREYDTQITINSAGFRDDEASLKKHDILMIGDSFVFGTGVSNGDTVADILESKSKLKVLNAGIPQYGTLQESMMFDRLTPPGTNTRCMTFLFFYAGNDLVNNINRTNDRNNYHPWIDQRQDSFKVIHPTLEGYSKWRARIASHDYPAVSQYSYTAYLITNGWKNLTNNDSNNRRKFSPSETFEALEFILNGLENRLQPEHKKNFAIVYIPKRTYYERAAYREKADNEYNRIVTIIRSKGIEFIDLRRVLSKSDYYELDGHWKPIGHKKVASTLVDHINSDAQSVCP
jgi:hypothetical protein